MKIITVGTVSAFLAILAIVASFFGKGALADYLNSPETASVITAVIQGILTIIAGVGAGIGAKKATE